MCWRKILQSSLGYRRSSFHYLINKSITPWTPRSYKIIPNVTFISQKHDTYMRNTHWILEKLNKSFTKTQKVRLIHPKGFNCHLMFRSSKDWISADYFLTNVPILYLLEVPEYQRFSDVRRFNLRTLTWKGSNWHEGYPIHPCAIEEYLL